MLAFPITFMNDSGQAVGALVRRYRIETPERIIVVHDELDLAPGELKVKAGGGLAGHNGLRAINAAPQDPGLPAGPHRRRQAAVEGAPAPATCCRRCRSAERELLDIRVAEAADAVEMIITDGVDAAMQRFNGKP